MDLGTPTSIDYVLVAINDRHMPASYRTVEMVALISLCWEEE